MYSLNAVKQNEHVYVCVSNPFAALLQVDNLSQEATNLLLLS